MKIVSALVKGGNSGVQEHLDTSMERLVVSEDELFSLMASQPDGFEHRVLVADRFKRPALLVRFRSRRPDRMISAIEDDLKKALRQLSGQRPGLIICHVPEVDSFEGVQFKTTVTSQMVSRVFSRPDAQNLVSVSFISDAQVLSAPGLTETNIESLKYANTRFKDSRLAIL